MNKGSCTTDNFPVLLNLIVQVIIEFSPLLKQPKESSLRFSSKQISSQDFKNWGSGAVKYGESRNFKNGIGHLPAD